MSATTEPGTIVALPDPVAESLPALIRARAGAFGAKPVMVNDDQTCTYGELDQRSRDLAGRLIGAGIGKGDRVGLVLQNGIDWLVSSVAVMRIGAVLVPLSTLLRPRELEDQLHVGAVSTLIAATEYRGRRYLDELDEAIPGIAGLRRGDGPRVSRLPNLQRAWTLDEVPGSANQSSPGSGSDDLVAAVEESVGPADDLVVLFTSGSRAAPKGVVHTHGGAITATAAGLEARCVGEGDRLYIPMPFFWTGGFAMGLLTTLVAGATLLTETEPSPEKTLRFLEQERATLFRGWPDQAVAVAAHPDFATTDLSSLRPGSLDAVLPPELRAAPGTRANIFGMTETFGSYCGTRLDVDLPESARGSCGKPFAAVEVRIVDPETGSELPAGEQGVIEVRGPAVMRAILGRTREDTFRPDGFYVTGDLGRLDVDGYLFYAGRADDMFKVSGATVYPSEVEAGLRSLPAVRQAYVTDLVQPDGSSLVGALVVTVGTPTLDELVTAARGTLSSFKVPKRWVLRTSADDVPMLASGKVDKSGLQALLAAEAVG